MKTKLQPITIISIMLLLFTACAIDGASKPFSETEKQMNYILAIAKAKPNYFIEVPSPNDIISEKLMLVAMAIDGGGSTAVEALDDYLKMNLEIHIGIVGRSQAINVMTIKQSLKNMAKQSAKGTIYVIANDKEKYELEAINKNSNINLVVISPQID